MSDQAGLVDALSLERFGRYLSWAGGDQARALELYALNTGLSEALYVPLQVLEVVLRNRVHAVLVQAQGPRWFETSGFLQVPHQVTQVAEQPGICAGRARIPLPAEWWRR